MCNAATEHIPLVQLPYIIIIIILILIIRSILGHTVLLIELIFINDYNYYIITTILSIPFVLYTSVRIK